MATDVGFFEDARPATHCSGAAAPPGGRLLDGFPVEPLPPAPLGSDAERLSDFMQYTNSNLAWEVSRLTGWGVLSPKKAVRLDQKAPQRRNR
jgi:hypothetical protein